MTTSTTPETVDSIAALRRWAAPGRTFRVTNYRYPNVSGVREVEKVQGNGMYYRVVERADGAGGAGQRGWIDWPKRLDVHFSQRGAGRTDVHFLDADGESIAFTFHLGETVDA
jgi:hypothetical protein